LEKNGRVKSARERIVEDYMIFERSSTGNISWRLKERIEPTTPEFVLSDEEKDKRKTITEKPTSRR